VPCRAEEVGRLKGAEGRSPAKAWEEVVGVEGVEGEQEVVGTGVGGPKRSRGEDVKVGGQEVVEGDDGSPKRLWKEVEGDGGRKPDIS
jgi:hypothetical protein